MRYWWVFLLGALALVNQPYAQTGEQPGDASYYEAARLFENGEADQAKAQLNHHLTQWPQDHAAFALRAMVYDQLGDTAAALADIEKALAMSYYTPAYHRNAGYIKQGLSKLAEAERHFRIYMNANREEALAYEQLAEVLLLQEKYKWAGEVIATGLRVAPNDEWLMVQQVRYLRAEALTDSAKTAALALVAWYPENAWGQRLMGEVLYELGEIGFCAHFNKAAKLGDSKARVLKQAYCEQNQDSQD